MLEIINENIIGRTESGLVKRLMSKKIYMLFLLAVSAFTEKAYEPSNSLSLKLEAEPQSSRPNDNEFVIPDVKDRPNSGAAHQTDTK